MTYRNKYIAKVALGIRHDLNADQREADRKFVRALAEAIWRGDHLPAGVPKPVRPLVLEG